MQYALATLSADALAGAGAGAVSFASFCVLKFATSLPTNVLATGKKKKPWLENSVIFFVEKGVSENDDSHGIYLNNGRAKSIGTLRPNETVFFHSLK